MSGNTNNFNSIEFVIIWRWSFNHLIRLGYYRNITTKKNSFSDVLNCSYMKNSIKLKF